MTDIYLDLVENFLSTELGVGFESSAMESVERLTRDQIQFFHQQWGEVDRGRHEVMALAQPFRSDSKENCADSANNISRQASDPAPTSALFTHPYNGLVDLDIELVKKQALLFSRVAVIAPSPGHRTNLGEARAEFASYFPDTAEVTRFRRLRREHGEITSYAENFVVVDIASKVDLEDLRHLPMTGVLRDRIGVRIGLVEDTAEAKLPAPDIAALLDIPLSSPVLYCVGVTRDVESRVVDIASIHYRGDRFKFAVTFGTE